MLLKRLLQTLFFKFDSVFQVQTLLLLFLQLLNQLLFLIERLRQPLRQLVNHKLLLLLQRIVHSHNVRLDFFELRFQILRYLLLLFDLHCYILPGRGQILQQLVRKVLFLHFFPEENFFLLLFEVVLRLQLAVPVLSEL